MPALRHPLGLLLRGRPRSRDPADIVDTITARIRRAAIVVEYAEGRAPIAECRAAECDGHWVGWEQITQLGRAIDTTVDLAVLEACGISLT